MKIPTYTGHQLFLVAQKHGFVPDAAWEATDELRQNCWHSLAAELEKGMQAALDHLYSSVGEGMPSVEEMWTPFIEGYDRVKDGSFPKRSKEGLSAVRNLWLTIIAKKLAPVLALPEKWRFDDEVDCGVTVQGCAAELESALSSLQLPPAVEPVPEVKPDRWAKEKEAFAQGRQIEVRYLDPISRKQGWILVGRPFWEEGKEYRIAPGQDEKPQPSTFEAHGRTWTKHVPGDPDPSEAGRSINVLHTDDNEVSAVSEIPQADKTACLSDPRAKGWRYADDTPQPETITHNGQTWLKHTPGDPCPVGGETRVEVLYADHAQGESRPAKEYFWTWDDEKAMSDTNIIGYRLADTPTQPTLDAWSPPAGLLMA